MKVSISFPYFGVGNGKDSRWVITEGIVKAK